MTGFDTFVVIDWSGGNDTGGSPRKDAIWAGVNRNGQDQDPVYLRNRTVAEAWIVDLIRAELEAERRVMIGFDFPFGYPAGFAEALTGYTDPLVLWDWFEARIEDSPETNNRFDLAAEMNLGLGDGVGPFWFNGLPNRDIPGLLRRKEGYANPFSEKRQAETRAKGAFSCWQMGGAGAVGSQVFMGLPVLSRLRKRFHGEINVWPFEQLKRPVAFVEVWPSLTVGDAPAEMIKDAWQVQELSRQMSELPAAALDEMLDVYAPEEGWIFGLGFEDRMKTASPLRNDCFALPPGVHWTPVDEALSLLRSRLSPVVSVETVEIGGALGRIVAQDVTAKRANPPLPNTAVDGYGFVGGRGDGPHQLPLADGRAAAGDAPGTVPAGQAIRILTGAALPTGVDTVVLQEDVRIEDGAVVFNGPIKPGANTRKAGEDVEQGHVVTRAGRRVAAADLALMAATGNDALDVYQPLRVGVISTGDEIVEPGGAASDGQIYDANRPMLLALVRQFGHTAVDLGHVGDDRAALRARLNSATGDVDAILTSGGASAGDEDHVSALLQEAGALSLWRVAVKPGRPLALGMWHGLPVFGLPGNPVAAMVCTLIFARPALSVMAGQEWTTPQGFDVPAAFEKRKKPGRREFLRARMCDGRVEVFASEGSGRISGLSWAEGLVELPDGAVHVRPGDMVRYIPYGSFGI
ncbi:gephyrin-like molybdotransferase Glp [Sulfitobacter sp. CW3]|uniref:molybdopterin-binding protein n=1 Tax=Sulfitobacter sp. CW3 TaxID=2861965 RepID=UPI001C5E0260|nr:gephyrin-like molybdotransferase Glp [Sulfitobacter sp. CW3]MBW4961982.1 molybdopterin molybdenumtransferase MoeA [Sulfitobacter sp. CW3]